MIIIIIIVRPVINIIAVVYLAVVCSVYDGKARRVLYSILFDTTM